MLTKLTVRRFKRFEDVSFELSRTVVLVGPNNQGKTTALQAIALWDLGRRKWLERGKVPAKRPGININRRDFVTVPMTSAADLWFRKQVRRGGKRNVAGKPTTQNLRIEVLAEGVTKNEPWIAGFEFDYSNDEILICRALRKPGYDDAPVNAAEWMDIPAEILRDVRVTYLPPMSGLESEEFLKQQGEIDVRIGQGQTARVLRNLCHLARQRSAEAWESVASSIDRLFGVRLREPVVENARLSVGYVEDGTEYDIASAGRGLQQTLLLLAHQHANPGTVLLLDEPDAHLEILRQRQIFDVLTESGKRKDVQIVAASHSEVMLNEAAERGTVVAFVGKPHPLAARSQ
jgi:ABC-type branched-subunit amino acid transport system ATPase component